MYSSFMLYLLNMFCAFLMHLIYKSQGNLNNHNTLQHENYSSFITGETGGWDSHLQTFHTFLSKNRSAQKHRGDKYPRFEVMYVGFPKPPVSAAAVLLHLLRYEPEIFAFAAWVYKCWTTWFSPWLDCMIYSLVTYYGTVSKNPRYGEFDGLYCNTTWGSHRWCICHHCFSWQHPSFTEWEPTNNGIKSWM